MEAGPHRQSAQTPPPEEHPLAPQPPAHPPAWAQRLLLAVKVAIALWTGILILLLPWTHLWTDNSLIAPWPAIKFFFNLTFVRGMVSGIGVMDIWMGASDVLHYRDLP